MAITPYELFHDYTLSKEDDWPKFLQDITRFENNGISYTGRPFAPLTLKKDEFIESYVERFLEFLS